MVGGEGDWSGDAMHGWGDGWDRGDGALRVRVGVMHGGGDHR